MGCFRRARTSELCCYVLLASRDVHARDRAVKDSEGGLGCSQIMSASVDVTR